MEPIKNIVSGVIGRMASGSPGSFQDIQAAWARVSKDKASRVEDLKNGTLVIVADSALRSVRLNLHRETFLKELKKDFPAIARMSFKVGQV